jgi:hypothetical protein
MHASVAAIEEGAMTVNGRPILVALGVFLATFAARVTDATAGVTLVDNVSVTINGVEQISNGDFSEGLIHWSTWDDDPSSTRGINRNHYMSSDASYQVDFRVHWWGPMSTRTYYDTSPTTQHFNGPPQYPDSSIWIPASPGQNVRISFMYKGKMGPSFILCLRASGEWFNLVDQRHWGSWEWTYAEMTATVPSDGVAIGFQFDVGFDDHGPSVDLEPSTVTANHKDTLSIAAHVLNNDPAVVNPVDIHLFAMSPSGSILVLKRLRNVSLPAGVDRTVVVFENVFKNRDRGNYDFFALIKESRAGNYFKSIGYFPFSVE